MTSAGNHEILTTGDIARLRGVDRTTAYRWLIAMERKHGARVVGRMGHRRLYTTRSALEAIGPDVRTGEDLPSRVARLEEQLAATVAQLTRVEARLAARAP